jgi:hypothetical protein
MGNGRFVNGKLNFVVSAAYVLNAAEKTLWQTCIQDASTFLYNATGGQVQFGDVYIVDDNFGRLDAEIILFSANALSGGTKGLFGTQGEAVRFYTVDRQNPHVLGHEMSHHVWDLGDEYAGPMIQFQIDKTSPAPNRRTIPVISGPALNTVTGQQAIVRFGDTYERRQIASNTTTQIVVVSDYPDLPTNSNENFATRQDTSVGCGRPSSSGVTFCIMEDQSGGVTNFCEPTNHNGAQDTDQEVRHNESCWETIIATNGFGSLTVPAGSPATPAAAVNFIDILKENRFSLVFDRSGSMAGDKLAYAKEGVKYWIDNCTLAGDFLSIVAYNSNNNIVLPITQASAIPNVATVQADVDALTATGQTNIRDAVREGVSQIISLPGRAVTQAVVVLTDGKHNRPPGTLLTEALPDLVDNGVKAVTIAIGEGNGVDAADLDELAFASGGIMKLVGLSNPIDIETALVEASLFLQGGLLDSESFDFIPAPPAYKNGRADIDALYKRTRVPTFVELMRALKIRNRKPDMTNAFRPYEDLFRFTIVYVERGCQRANFSINYGLQADFDLFLIDPTGAPLDVDGNLVKKVTGRKSHKIVTVERPRSGVWTVVIFARRPPSRNGITTVNLSVGAENRNVVVTGGCSKSVYKSIEPVRLFASAKWGDGLTELKVEATVTAADGTTSTYALTDGGAMAYTSGQFSAMVQGLKVGQYKGVISVESKTRNRRADARDLLMHSTSASVDFRSPAPKFVRALPFYFEVIKGR